MKIIFDIEIEISIIGISTLSIFNFGNTLGWSGGKYFIEIIFDIKIEIRIFKISNMPNFNKSKISISLDQFGPNLW